MNTEESREIKSVRNKIFTPVRKRWPVNKTLLKAQRDDGACREGAGLVKRKTPWDRDTEEVSVSLSGTGRKVGA